MSSKRKRESSDGEQIPSRTVDQLGERWLRAEQNKNIDDIVEVRIEGGGESLVFRVRRSRLRWASRAVWVIAVAWWAEGWIGAHAHAEAANPATGCEISAGTDGRSNADDSEKSRSVEKQPS